MHISILDGIVRAGGDSAGRDADLQYNRHQFGFFSKILSVVSCQLRGRFGTIFPSLEYSRARVNCYKKPSLTEN